jgi:hypothetical protein
MTSITPLGALLLLRLIVVEAFVAATKGIIAED